jgi:hypothetical protein
MKAKGDAAIVKKVIARFGPMIDLRKHPEVLIEILRQFKFDDGPDGGDQPCGGTPPPPSPEPPPPPPPPSSSSGASVTNEEILKAVLRLSRDVAAMKKLLPAVKTKSK